MGEHYEAYRIASALANGDINDASNVLLQDAQRMNPNTFSYMLNDANQQSAAANPNSDQLQISSDQNGLPVVNFVNPNNQIDQQISLPQQQPYDAPPPPPPPEEYPSPQGGQYLPPQEGYPPPPPPQQYYGNEQPEYNSNPNQCEGQTVLGAALGALAGGLLTGGRSRGIGIGVGAVAGGAIANNGCP
jgi:hypothetical protein